MKKLKEVYRLKFELGYSHRVIAESLAISPSTVSDYVKLFSLAGLFWNDAKELSIDALENAIYRHPQKSHVRRIKLVRQVIMSVILGFYILCMM